MNRTLIFTALLFLASIFAPSTCLAQINDGKEKWFNPLEAFQSASNPISSTSPTIDPLAEPTSDDSFSFKPPKWLNPIEIGRSTKVGVQKLSAGTKKAWSSTVDLLNPFDKKSQPTTTQSPFSLSSNGYKPQMLEPPKKKFKWWWQKDEAEEPSSINGWLSQQSPLSIDRPMAR